MGTVGDLVDAADLREDRRAVVKSALEDLGYSPDEAVGESFLRLTEAQLRDAGLSVREVNAMLAKIAPASGAPRAPLLDSSKEIIRELFSPFPGDAFPVHAERTRLMDLLQRPFTTSVPLSPHAYQSLGSKCIGLFRVDETRAAPKLEYRLATALETEFRPEGPTELNLTSFWDNIGFELPEWVGKQLGLRISMRRNKVDISITQADRLRDYFILVENVLLVGGEDKAREGQMRDAIADLIQKHKGANAAVYGGLHYILLIATAGNLCNFYSLNLDQDAELIDLGINLRLVADRGHALKVFINMVRWLHTVVVMQLLPPPPPAPMLEEFSRPSPYGAGGDTVQITLHLSMVEKKFRCPTAHALGLVNVYKQLTVLHSSLVHQPFDAIKCRSMKVNGYPVDLEFHGAPPLPSTRTNPVVYVELELGPIGSVGVVRSEQDLVNMVRSVATTLKAAHSVGLVHRDLRADNILRQDDPVRWLVIDWELAGFVGESVWWPGKALPPFAQRGQLYSRQGDFWQLGNLFHGHAMATAEAKEFAGRMMRGDFQDAQAVLDNMWA